MPLAGAGVLRFTCTPPPVPPWLLPSPRSSETRRVMPADVIVLEGILVLHMEEIRAMLNMKVGPVAAGGCNAQSCMGYRRTRPRSTPLGLEG